MAGSEHSSQGSSEFESGNSSGSDSEGSSEASLMPMAYSFEVYIVIYVNFRVVTAIPF